MYYFLTQPSLTSQWILQIYKTNLKEAPGDAASNFTHGRNVTTWNGMIQAFSRAKSLPRARRRE
jgi:hypothetical protein